MTSPRTTSPDRHAASTSRALRGLLLLLLVGAPSLMANTCGSDEGSLTGAGDTAADLGAVDSVDDMRLGADLGEPLDMVARDMSLTDSGAQPSTPLTYYADIKPIVHRHCESCHRVGDVGPYPLDSYESFKEHVPMAMASIRAGSMPPWSPDPDCRHYKDERLISEDEVDTLQRWIDGGMLEGDAQDWTEPAPDPRTNRSPDLVGNQNLPYVPTAPPLTDDYQCYVIDLEFAQDTYVTGTTVVPGNRELVHHANLFLVNPTNAPKLDELQDRDPDPGYECFGNAGINQTNLVGAWVPGAQPIFMPEDAAIVIEQGSKLVLQVHYNTLYADPQPVESEVHLFTQAAPPAKEIRAMPIANLTFEVPPGEKESVHTIKVRNSTSNPWKIIGTGPHLHLLASAVKVEVIRRDEEQENVCLVDIPDWDFNWQQEYRFLDDEWVDVAPGDSVQLTCVFDNSPENQPVIDGEKQPPVQLDWGAKSSDEMCLNFLVVMQDYDPNKVNGPLCSEFKACRPECDDPNDIGCIFNCAAEEQSCGECLLFGAQDCASRYCRRQLSPTIPCLLVCAQGAQGGGNIEECLIEECPAEYEALSTCMTPYIEQGLCNQYVEECNVAF